MINVKEFHYFYSLANAGSEDDRIDIQHYINSMIYMDNFVDSFVTTGRGLPTPFYSLRGGGE